MPRRTLKTMLASGVCAFALAAGGMAAAQTRDFDVPAGDLSVALDAYARQSGVQIIYRIADVSGVRSQGAKGAYSPDEALAQLLEGTRFKIRRDPSGAIAIADASDPQSGSAAGDGAEGTVQALIVTAQKREENIQDVPIAMSAFTQEDLTRSQVAGGPDLMTQVPNFTFTKTNFTGYSIQIRGIGTQAISATTDAAVAVAFNNTPFIRNRFFEQEFYDLQRVEVLRGPQGTLYGRNATAGVVNIISAKPTFNFAARLSADVANFNSTRLEGMVNLPLADDAVALRIAGAWTKRDGYDTNEVTGNRIDGRDIWSTRLSLRIQPTDAFRADVIWEHFNESDDRLRSGKQLCNKDTRDNINGVPFNLSGFAGLSYPPRVYTQGCVMGSLYGPEAFQTPNGFSLPYYAPLIQLGMPGVYRYDPYLSATQSRDLRVIESGIDPKYMAKNDLGELQISYNLSDDLTLTSETAVARDVIWSMEDFNRFTTSPGAFEYGYSDKRRDNLIPNGVFCDPQLGCSDRLLAADLSTARSKHFSQEFRLSSDFDGPFNFSLGANFLRYDTVEKYYVFINTLTATAAINVCGTACSPAPEDFTPWDPATTDNLECMLRGRTYGDPYAIYNVDNCKYIETNSIENIQDMGHNYFLSKNPYKLISYAVFGEAYYNIAENLKLTAGLRWTVDKKRAPRVPSQLFATYSAGYPVAEVVQQEWREPTGRLALDWKPDLSFTDDTLVYGSYAHGYKAGGANPPTGVIVMYCSGCSTSAGLADKKLQDSLTHPKTFGPEFVNAFEVGAKNTLLDGAMTLNLAGFYYDYTGYQISEIVERSAFNHNYDAKVWGAEIEADWRPLENLRLGFKGGYENTRVAKGMYAIDLMDRTAGDPNWVVAKPFPTFPSNCIIPAWVATWPGEPNGGGVRVPAPGDGVCEVAYEQGLDPVTGHEYVPNPTESIYDFNLSTWPGYPGWNPATAPNHGEGIAKNLSGHQLPNAPKFTATITADYAVPLPNSWLMTLHTDLYYQSEAWTRIFNDPGYDKLKAYSNINLAAIFSNEDAGWKIMAYVKNVLDKDNITGAFLNSDDTGLTTNVFLNEPRLYGIRLTKEWSGAPWWTSSAHDPNLPYPFRLEVGGQVLRHDAPNETIRPAFFNEFDAYLNPAQVQNQDQDWGQGGSVRLTYTPSATGWWAEGGVRWGKTSSTDKIMRKEVDPQGHCIVGPPFDNFCVEGKYFQQGMNLVLHPVSYANAHLDSTEQHTFADFMVGRDFGLGLPLAKSEVAVGLGYADLRSQGRMDLQGVPFWQMPNTWAAFKYSQHDRYIADWDIERTFKGAGPMAKWEGATRLLQFENAGRLNVDWTASGGLLFGKQKARIDGQVSDAYVNEFYYLPIDFRSHPTVTNTPVNIDRDKSATVPMLDLSLGLSYEIDRIRVATGYRWERYFNAIDGGYQDHKSFDRTYDGPYFKVSVGFGG